jgi:hypothetical protein
VEFVNSVVSEDCDEFLQWRKGVRHGDFEETEVVSDGRILLL